MAFATGPNLFQYAFNRPVLFIDPSGAFFPLVIPAAWIVKTLIVAAAVGTAVVLAPQIDRAARAGVREIEGLFQGREEPWRGPIFIDPRRPGAAVVTPRPIAQPYPGPSNFIVRDPPPLEDPSGGLFGPHGGQLAALLDPFRPRVPQLPPHLRIHFPELNPPVTGDPDAFFDESPFILSVPVDGVVAPSDIAVPIPVPPRHSRLQCRFYYEWCLWGNACGYQIPENFGRVWRLNAPCNECHATCRAAGLWPFGVCPIAGNPLDPTRRDRDLWVPGLLTQQVRAPQRIIGGVLRWDCRSAADFAAG